MRLMKSLRQFYWFVSSIVKRHATTIVVSGIVGILVTLNIETVFRLLPRSTTTYVGRAGNFTLAQLPAEKLYYDHPLYSLQHPGTTSLYLQP